MQSGAGVYVISCLPTGEVYVGSSATLAPRLWAHRSQLRAGSHPNRALQEAWVRWGEDNFDFLVVENLPEWDGLAAAERRWIAEYASREPGRLFNLAQPHRRVARDWSPTATTATAEALLDAAERLLIVVGYAGVSARRLGEEAGANHGLIHYYFGSMEQLFVRVVERYTDRLIERQRAMYAADVPFVEKWRTAMGFLDEDRESGYQKIWLELQALAWNRPELRDRMAGILARWYAVLTEAFGKAIAEYGIDTERFPVEGIVKLVATVNEGLILERLGGIFEGHDVLLQMIDRWLVSLEEAKARRAAEGASHASEVS